MVNITHKSNTLRQAIATAVVAVSAESTIAAIKNNQVPKGNVFEMSKTAGLFAAKRTSDMIPDCHPLPIEYTHISFEVKELEIHIFVEVHTIYKTIRGRGRGNARGFGSSPYSLRYAKAY